MGKGPNPKKTPNPKKKPKKRPETNVARPGEGTSGLLPGMKGGLKLLGLPISSQCDHFFLLRLEKKGGAIGGTPMLDLPHVGTGKIEVNPYQGGLLVGLLETGSGLTQLEFELEARQNPEKTYKDKATVLRTNKGKKETFGFRDIHYKIRPWRQNFDVKAVDDTDIECILVRFQKSHPELLHEMVQNQEVLFKTLKLPGKALVTALIDLDNPVQFLKYLGRTYVDAQRRKLQLAQLLSLYTCRQLTFKGEASVEKRAHPVVTGLTLRMVTGQVICTTDLEQGCYSLKGLTPDDANYLWELVNDEFEPLYEGEDESKLQLLRALRQNPLRKDDLPLEQTVCLQRSLSMRFGPDATRQRVRHTALLTKLMSPLEYLPLEVTVTPLQFKELENDSGCAPLSDGVLGKYCMNVAVPGDFTVPEYWLAPFAEILVIKSSPWEQLLRQHLGDYADDIVCAIIKHYPQNSDDLLGLLQQSPPDNSDDGHKVLRARVNIALCLEFGDPREHPEIILSQALGGSEPPPQRSVTPFRVTVVGGEACTTNPAPPSA